MIEELIPLFICCWAGVFYPSPRSVEKERFELILKKLDRLELFNSFELYVCSACLMCVCENNKIYRFLYIYMVSGRFITGRFITGRFIMRAFHHADGSSLDVSSLDVSSCGRLIMRTVHHWTFHHWTFHHADASSCGRFVIGRFIIGRFIMRTFHHEEGS